MISPPGSTRPSFFFFNDTATPEIYTLSLHDALPIHASFIWGSPAVFESPFSVKTSVDRKSTRLNSSHVEISYADFCLKKKKTQALRRQPQNAQTRASKGEGQGKAP